MEAVITTGVVLVLLGGGYWVLSVTCAGISRIRRRCRRQVGDDTLAMLHGTGKRGEG